LSPETAVLEFALGDRSSIGFGRTVANAQIGIQIVSRGGLSKQIDIESIQAQVLDLFKK
jgi:hypothetical protein